jgi:hypothetical protein
MHATCSKIYSYKLFKFRTLLQTAELTDFSRTKNPLRLFQHKTLHVASFQG